LSTAVETLCLEVSAADRDLDLVMRRVVDFLGVLGVGHSTSFTIEQGTDLHVVNSIYCFYNSQPQASWSRKNG
jgi:hypothetical protein